MTSNATLQRLIADLRKSTSGLEQLKIITRAWASVRKLSRKERIELATHIGFEEGKVLLERFGEPGGVSPARLAEAVLKAERANPGELNRLLGDLRDSSKRPGALRKAVRLAEAALEEVAPEPPAPTRTPPPPPLENKVVDREPLPPAVPEAATPELAMSSSAEAASAALPPPAVVPELAEREQPPQKPTQGPSPEIVESRTLKSAPPSPSLPQISKAPAGAAPRKRTEKALGLETSPTLMARFRLLNNLAREGGLTEEDIELVLRAFPPGWPRRRALSALIRTGAVGNLDRILTALSQLSNPGDEFWCVSALAQSRHLTPEDVEKLMAGVSYDSSRRLLKRMRLR